MAKRFVVPDTYMVPLGAKITRDLGKCADNFTDSDIKRYRPELPVEFHSVSEEDLRRRWINIRKKGTPGYRINGKGPQKGSRRTSSLPPVPSKYVEYLQSDSWKQRRKRWLLFWGHRCCICNVHDDESVLDVHHRCYENVGREELTDCVLLCRSCHGTYENKKRETTRELFSCQ